MGKEGLVSLVKDAQNLEEVFRKLKDEILIVKLNLSEFAVAESRKEFAIVKEIPTDYFYLHPYGTSIGYNVMEKILTK